LDRGAVEPDALLERRLQFGRRDRDALERAEHDGEPQPDKADIPLLQRPEHELLLSVHDVSRAADARPLVDRTIRRTRPIRDGSTGSIVAYRPGRHRTVPPEDAPSARLPPENCA